MIVVVVIKRVGMAITVIAVERCVIVS